MVSSSEHIYLSAPTSQNLNMILKYITLLASEAVSGNVRIDWANEEELLDNGCGKIIMDQGRLEEDGVADWQQDRNLVELFNKHFLACVVYIDQEFGLPIRKQLKSPHLCGMVS